MTSLYGPDRSTRPRDAGYGADHPAAQGVLHRHQHLHRLQGLRGGLQGVERRPGRRLRPARHLLRQHRLARRQPWRHVAFIEQPAAGRVRTRGRRRERRPGDARRWAPTGAAEQLANGRGRAGTGLPLADVLGRLQALHPRGLPRRVPDRLAVPHRVRHGRRAAGHLQRLRLLRPGLPVRRHRAARGPRVSNVGVPRSARCATTGSTTGRSPACAQACPTESIQYGDLDELRERADRRVDAAARGRGHRGAALRRRPGRRRRRQGRLLPAARRARGLRLAARPGGHHPGPAAHVSPGRPPPR